MEGPLQLGFCTHLDRIKGELTRTGRKKRKIILAIHWETNTT